MSYRLGLNPVQRLKVCIAYEKQRSWDGLRVVEPLGSLASDVLINEGLTGEPKRTGWRALARRQRQFLQ